MVKRFDWQWVVLLGILTLAWSLGAAAPAGAAEAPVAAYSLDAGEGAVAEDLFGEHDGAIEGADWFANGRFGQALSFDSSEEDCVTVADAPDLQLTEEFTIEAWAKPTGSGEFEPLIYKETEDFFSYSLFLGLQESGKVEGLLGGEEEEIGPDVESDEALPTNVWTHVALTYDGAKLRLYVNGELQDTTTAELGALPSSGPLTIGCADLLEFEDFYDGLIDEVRIYNRALDGGEVVADAGAGLEVPARSPVAAYSLDAGEGAVAEDLFGEHDGAIEGADWFANGRFGQALSFDSSEEDCVTVADAPDLQLTEEFTIEAWAKPTGSGEFEPLIYKETEDFFSYSLFLGLQESGKVEGLLGGEEEEIGPDVESDEALPTNVWTHVALTYDGAKLRLYVNGELQDTTTAELGALPSSGPLTIGCADLLEFEDFYDGLIDEVRIYNRALDGGEVVADAGAGLEVPARSPVAAYSLDAGEGAVAEDLFGEHDGAIEGADWFANGRFGQALSFDSSEEDCVTVADAPDLQLTEEFTIEAWAKPTGSGEFEPLIYKETEDFFSYSLFLGLQESGKVEGLLGGEEEEIGPDVESDEALPTNVWTHVALTYDGAKLRLYVNGELQDTTTAELGALPSSGPLTIGCADLLEFEDFYDGLIDEVRIYNRALDGGEVVADAGAGLEVPARSPVAAYSLDAGEGAVAEDLFGEHDGAIEGADWFANGRFGQALSFDSSEEDCVTVADAPDLQLTEEFTIEAWAKPTGSGEFEPLIYKETEDFFSYSLFLGLQESGKVEGLLGGEEEEIGPDVESDEALPTNVWTHVALTYDGAKLRLYVNGELQDTTTAELGALPSSGPLTIGCADLLEFEDFYDGLIDEVRIYNRALDGGEVVADAGAGLEVPARSPVAAYAFDENEGAVIEDMVGEHDGAIQGADWFENGKYRSALSFKYTEEDCVTVEDAPDLQLTEEFTLGAWVRPSGEVKSDPIFFKETEGFFAYSLGLGLASSGKLEAYIGDEEEEHTLVVSPDPLQPNVWAHVALTYDGAKLRLYLNGEHVDTNASTTGNMPSTGPLEIGCSDLFNQYFNGLIDEVRVYNRALSDEEVNASLQPLPAINTAEAYGVDPTEAVLVGDLDPRNAETRYYFEYGTTPAYGSKVPEVSEDIVTGDEVREVEEAVDELEPETTYHFRIVATDPAGNVVGRDKTLTTGASATSPQQLEEQREELFAKTNWQGFVNGHWTGSLNSQAATMTMIKESGAKMFRVVINNTGSTYDETFKLAAERGITVLPNLVGIPGRNDNLISRDNPKTGIRLAWREKVHEIVKEYGRKGDFWKAHPGLPELAPEYWEIWNEPNYGNNGTVKKIRSDGTGKVVPADYGDLLEESNQVIEEVDSTAKILFGGLLTVGRNKGNVSKVPVGQFIKEAGHPKAYDALSLHPYAFQAPGKNVKDRTPNNANDVAAITRKVKRNIQSARAALDRAEGGKAIWITELGWPVKTPITPNDKTHLPVTEDIQRDLLHSTFNMIKSHSGEAEQSFNIAKVFYYNVEDHIGEGKWDYRAGLREDEDLPAGQDYGQPGRFRKAWFAFQNQADFKGKFP